MMMEYYQLMKLLIKIFFSSFFFSILLFAQDCKSKLVIETELTPVNIFINDSLVSDSGFYQSELDSGWYKINVIESSDRWNSLCYLDTVFVSECTTKKLFYKRNNKIYLDTSPQDAYVFSGDSLLGNTPLFIQDNLYNITLIKPGYAEENIKLDNIAQNNLVKLTSLDLPKEKSFFYSSAFHILAATAVALGAFSAYYKLKADDSYDEYQISRDPELLDDTNRYDLISGIAFTALQINFGFIIYKFLTD